MSQNPRLCVIVFFFILFNFAMGDVLYDVTFSAPDYVAGQPSVTGSGSSSPASNIFGTSTVVTNLGAHDQSLLLVPQNIGSFNYSQYLFSTPIPADQKYLRTSFDVFVETLADPVGSSFAPGPDDGFSLLFDTPSVVRLDFTGAGSILENANPIGQFTKDAWNSVTVDIDFTDNSWSIFNNGLLLADTQFFHPYPANPEIPSSVISLRMNLADYQGTVSVPMVYVDNIFIASSDQPFGAPAAVPESLSLGAYLAFSILALIVIEKVKRRRGVSRI